MIQMRTIHEDSNGLSFAAIDNNWHLAYPLQILSALVGALGASGNEDLPINIYFVSWYSENTANKYY